VQKDLSQLNNNSDMQGITQQIHDKETELDKLLETEELWWSQRSRALWLQHGDRNTKFFHQKASQRRKKNKIDTIMDSNGETHSNPQTIENTLITHFETLFTSQATHNINLAVKGVKDKITSEMKDFLNNEFTAEEVSMDIKGMKGLAAPGPDGLPALFYHNYWEVVGPEVTSAVLEVLNKDGDPSQFNNTHICLIPNKNNPSSPSDYRPISLCNVTLKIITKTIANRLKLILPTIISPNQSAFVPGRLITDNILVAYEAFHHFKHSASKKGYMGVKTDMAKAYDRVEWNFLQSTLEAMGFPHNITDTIMDCVSNVSFSILINGKPSNPFTPQRGLRQGDPLSPYLFILCANVLSGLITRAQQDEKLHGIKIAHSAPAISHLFFADDSLFFL
jgi:hypothetical protein